MSVIVGGNEMRWRDRLRWTLRAIDNYRRGYAYGPVRRSRCCGHTTPGHYGRCVNWRVGQ